MEAWRDELYHYGVRGMKWKHKKEQKSATADALREKANINQVYGNYEVALGRDRDRKSLNYSKQYNKKTARLIRTAKALERGKRSQAPRVKNDGLEERGIGLYRRGKVSGTTARGSSKSSKGLTSSGRYSGARSKRKERAAKYVKRVLA